MTKHQFLYLSLTVVYVLKATLLLDEATAHAGEAFAALIYAGLASPDDATK